MHQFIPLGISFVLLLYYYSIPLEFIFGIVALGVLFYYYAIKPINYWSERGVQQGWTVWLLGDNWGTVIKKHSFVDMVQHVYDAVPGCRYSGMYQFTIPTLLVKDKELIKQICVKDFEYFTDHRTFVSEKADALFAKNLFFLKGQAWREMRPVLSPSFTSSKMKSMFVLMSECGETFTNFFLKKDQDIIEMEMKETFTRFTNDVIATTAFGIKIDSLEEPNNEFYLMGKDVSNFSGFWKTARFFGMFLFPKLFEVFNISLFGSHVYKFFIDLVDSTIKTREEKGIIRPDMIHLLMEARKGREQKDEQVIDTGFAVVDEADLGKGNAKEITNLDIAAHAMVFFFAGFDGVSSLMCFMSYELALNPDIQWRLRQEIEETFQACDGALTYEALLKMKYMDMVLSETLRKWPLGAQADRLCTKPYTIPPATLNEKPLHIERGTVIWIPIWAIHRDSKYYPDPERFDPERFNDDNKSKIDPYTYLPFGIGPRNCIGSRFALLETKVVMFNLLKNFELVPITKTKIPLRLSKTQLNPVAEGGFWLGLKRIKK